MPPSHFRQTLDEITNCILRNDGVIVFDFDGVMANTEPLHLQAYSRLLQNRLPANASFTFERYMGRPEEEIYDMINADYGLTLSIAEDKPKRLREFRKLFREKNLQPAAFVKPLLAVRRPIYILSSQDEGLIREVLARWEIDQYTMIDYRSSLTSKLTAIIYLADILETTTAQIYHFEDSVSAIEISSRSGHNTIFVKHNLNKDDDVEATWTIAID